MKTSRISAVNTVVCSAWVASDVRIPWIDRAISVSLSTGGGSVEAGLDAGK
jgi:hypothetical protein